MSNSPAPSSLQPDNYCFSLVIKLCKRLKAFDVTLLQAQRLSAEMVEVLDREVVRILRAGCLKIDFVYVEKPKLDLPPLPMRTEEDEDEEQEDGEQEEVTTSASKLEEMAMNPEETKRATLAPTQPRATRFDAGSIPRNNRERESLFFGSPTRKEGVEQVRAKEKLRNELQSALDECEKLSEDIVEVVLDLVLESNRVKLEVN